MTTYAGLYGPETLFDRAGRPLRLANIVVFAADGVTPAVLYTSRTKAATTPSNTVQTTTDGNLSFFADPGAYRLRWTVAGVTHILDVEVPQDFVDQGGAVLSVNGRTGVVALAAADVGAVPQSAVGVSVAQLVGGKVPSAQIPSLSWVRSHAVANQAAMLALTGVVAGEDLAIRQDGAGTFLLTGADPSQLGSWTLLPSPTDAVVSVNGRTGAVVLAAADVGADASGAATAVQGNLTTHTSNTSNPHATTAAQTGAPNVVVHGATAGTARPAGATLVLWIGSVAPTNAATNDWWWDTSVELSKRWSGSAWKASGAATYEQARATPQYFDSSALTYPARSGATVWYGPWLPTGAQPGDTWHFRPPATPRPVIFDTDLWTDVDDAVAARVLCHAERLGLVDIRAAVIDTKLIRSPGALSALFEFEGRGDLPIGVGTYVPSGAPTWQTTVYDGFPHRLGLPVAQPTAVDTYRRALAAAADGSVDIISVGYLTNLKDLLASAGDAIDARTGSALVAAKVRHLWVSGGVWPTAGAAENNFGRDATAAAAANNVVANWPVAQVANAPVITFCGYEVGINVLTGGNLSGTSAVDPLASALNAAGFAAGRSSWDPMMTWLAALADPTTAGYTTVQGTATVNSSTGVNGWTNSGTGPHRYVVKGQTDRWFQADINSRLVPGRDPVPGVPPGVVTGLQQVTQQRTAAAKTPTVIPARTSSLASSLLVHLHADDLSDLTVGDPISHLDDRMYYRPARQLTAGSRPTLGSVTSKNTIHFTGSQRLVTDTLPWPAAVTLYVRVYLATLPSANQYIIAADDSGSSLRVINVQLSAANVAQGVAFYPNTTGNLATAAALTAATFQTITIRSNASGVQAFLDGVAGSLTAKSGSNTGWQGLALGSKQIDANSTGLVGDIREVRVYGTYHDDATVASVVAAMAA